MFYKKNTEFIDPTVKVYMQFLYKNTVLISFTLPL